MATPIAAQPDRRIRLSWEAVVAMSEQLSAVMWEIALFIVPAAAIFVAAGRIRATRQRIGEPQQNLNGWIIAAAVILAGPILAAGAAAVTSWNAGFGAYGVPLWLGIGLLLLACLVLGFIHARAAGWTLVVLAFVLPTLVALTGQWWVIDDQAGTPTPESVGLGTLAVIVLFSIPALVSGILLFIGGRTRGHVADTTATTPDRGTDAAESSTAPGSHTPSPSGRNERKGLV
jgi:hypothetical protein